MRNARSLTIRASVAGYQRWAPVVGDPQVHKFEQVSSLGYQMLLAGGGP